MSKSTKIKQFNSTLEQFLQQLSPIIGSSYHHYFTKFIKVNAISPIQQFSSMAIPVRDKIINEDETYFTTTENHTDFIQDDEYTLNEILRLKDIYFKLNESNRKEVWTYFKIFLCLAEDYSSS